MAKKVDLEHFIRMLPGLEARERGPVEPYPSQVTKLRENETKHPNLVPFETKGRANFLRRYPQMRAHYGESEDKAKEGYDNLPFGPNTKAAFNAATDANPEKEFENKLIVSHEKMWANRWMRGISR